MGRLISLGAAALIVGLDGIGFAVALAGLMFTGALASGLASGIAAVLACCIVMALTIGTFSQFRTNMASAQDIGVAILAVILSATVAKLSAEALVPTAFAIIATTTLATGAVLYLVGLLKAGQAARYFPLEVLAGFMVSTGILLLLGGIAMVAHVQADLHGLLGINSSTQVLHLIPAIALAAAIVVAMARVRSPAALIGMLLLATGLFHLFRVSSGMSMQDAAAAGWLPNLPVAEAKGFDFALLEGIARVDWSAVATTVPTIATIAVISLFATLLNLSALEIATGEDVDLNREIRVTGLANLIAAPTGGPPGYTILVSTLMLQKFGISQRGLNLAVATVLCIGLWFAGEIARTVPSFVAAALILYFGYDLVKDWLINTWYTFSRREWAVVLLIAIVSLFYGFLLAILAGLVISALLFAYSYANSPAVRLSTNLARLPSTVERAPEEISTLAAIGKSVHVIRLQGFLFFGTTEKVMGLVQKAVKTASDRQSLIIDFALVTEMDSASANAFKRIAALASKQGFFLLLCGLNPSASAALSRVGVLPGPHAQFLPTLDDALQLSEHRLLSGRDIDHGQNSLAFRYGLAGKERDLQKLFAEMEKRVHAAGSRIIATGDEASEVYFIESGRAVVERRQPDGTMKRLRTMLSGAIVGDVGYAIGGKRTADVTAEENTVTLSISSRTIAKLAREKPELAFLFNSILHRGLAEKVLAANRMTEHVG